MRYAILTAATLLAATEASAARITFTVTAPPRHAFDAPSNRIVLLRMEGRTEECSHPFLRIELREAVKATDAVLEDVSHLKSPLEQRRATHAADLYLVSEDCVCRAGQRPQAEGWRCLGTPVAARPGFA